MFRFNLSNVIYDGDCMTLPIVAIFVVMFASACKYDLHSLGVVFPTPLDADRLNTGRSNELQYPCMECNKVFFRQG